MVKGSSFTHIFSDEEFHQLVETAARLEDGKISIQSVFILIAAGMLGLRRGEILHFHPDWVDTKNQILIIPDYYPCDCSYCQDQAEDYAESNDVPFSEAIDEYWKPKTDRGERTIPYGAFPDVVVKAIETYKEYLEETESNLTRSTLQRRLRLVAELTEGIDRERAMPRVLRATAASRLARMGITITALQRMFGWRYPHVAAYYLWMSGVNLRRELRRIHWNPPRESDVFVDFLRYRPPTHEEWREFGTIEPPDGYTPTPLDEEGQLERMDDEEALLAQAKLQRFAKNILAPLAVESDESELEDEEELEDIDDEHDLMMATVPGLHVFITSVGSGERLDKEIERILEQNTSEVNKEIMTVVQKPHNSTERAVLGVIGYTGILITMLVGYLQSGIRVSLVPFNIQGNLLLIAIALLTLVGGAMWVLYKLYVNPESRL